MADQEKIEQSKFIDIVFVQNTLVFLEVTEIVRLNSLSKQISTYLTQNKDEFGYWHAMCVSLANKQGIYLSPSSVHDRKFFFNSVWNSRNKWSLAIANGEQSQFKIQTMVRFRPGKGSNSGIELPLHQFLKLRRKNTLEKSNNANLVGESDPEHFLDPFLFTLMREPVKLVPSGKILDRSVAIHFVLRGGKDPFTGEKLTSDMLEPMPDLQKEISEWRERQRKAVDISVSLGEVKSIIEENVLDPTLLDALIEAEMLTYAAQRAAQDATNNIETNNSGNNHVANHNATDDSTPQSDEEVLPLPPNINGKYIDLISRDANKENEVNSTTLLDSASESNMPCDAHVGEARWRKGFGSKNAPRLIDISKQKASVSMSCPGVGIRNFNFSGVFPANDNQHEVYQKSAKDLVAAVMNGSNASLLCYGQTG